MTKKFMITIYFLVLFLSSVVHSEHTTFNSSRPWQNYLNLGNISRPFGYVLNNSLPAHLHFSIGYLCLHSFLYDEARESFQYSLDIDPTFIYSHIGRILACKRSLWSEVSYSCGRAAINQTKASINFTGLTGLPKMLFDAAQLWYRNQSDIDADENAFLVAIQNISQMYPNVTDVKAWYGLAQLNVADQIRYQNITEPQGMKDARVTLNNAYQSEPRHPGILHYLIHAYDVTLVDVAKSASEFARSYGEIVKTASHAQHMPSHIWMRIGSWRHAAAADRSAILSSLSLCGSKLFDVIYAVNSTELEPILNRSRIANRTHELLSCDPDNRCHSLEWLSYADFQQGIWSTSISSWNHLRVSNQNFNTTKYLHFLYRVQARAIVDLFFWYPYKDEFVRRVNQSFTSGSPLNIVLTSNNETRAITFWSEATIRFSECVRMISNRNMSLNESIINEHVDRMQSLRNQTSTLNSYLSGNIEMMIPIINGMRAYIKNSIQEALNNFSSAVIIENRLVPDANSPTLILGRAAEFLGLHLQLIYDSQNRNNQRSLSDQFIINGNTTTVRNFPQQSIKLYQQVNQSAPHRSINLLGLAKSYQQSGNKMVARNLYDMLLNQMDRNTTGDDRIFFDEVNSMLQSVQNMGSLSRMKWFSMILTFIAYYCFN